MSFGQKLAGAMSSFFRAGQKQSENITETVVQEDQVPVEEKKPPRTKMTAKQRKLLRLQAKVNAGELTQQQAMLDAGYAPTSAREQSAVLGTLGNRMQDALRERGFDEEFIADEITEGAETLDHGPTKLAYVKTGAQLLDVVPSQKVDKNLNVTGRVHLSSVIDDADGDEETIEDEKDSEQDSLDVSKEQHAAS